MTRVHIAQPDAEEDVSAEQVAAYLLRPGSGWVEMTALSSPHYIEFEFRPRAPDQNDGACGVPREACKRPTQNMLECIHDIARAEQRHPSAVLADIVGPARAASVGAYCEPWLFVAELRVRLSCKLPACDLMGCSAARGAGESEEP